MPATRSCKDTMVKSNQSKIPFPCRKSSRNCQVKVQDIIKKRETSKIQNEKYTCSIKSQTKQQKSPLRSSLGDGTNKKDVHHITVVKRKISDGEKYTCTIKSPVHQQKTPLRSPLGDCTNKKDVHHIGVVKRKILVGKVTCSPTKKFAIENGIQILPNKTTENKILKSKQMRNSKTKGPSVYNEIKEALHTSIPKKLISREEEIGTLKNFIERTVNKGQKGSLYMSGAPGTGKTACLMKVIEQCKECQKLQSVYINCMSIKQSQSIFSKLAQRLSNDTKPIKESIKILEKTFTSSGPKILLVLDEIDQLESKNQEVLYKLFEMPFLPNSRLILIGIANALDLTDRILPRLQGKSSCKPVLLQFPPYTKDEVFAILKERVQESKSNVIDEMAIQFCARKVSSMSGDARKALEIMRRAVEYTETESKAKSENKENTTSTIKKVTISSVSSVCSEVYGSKVAKSSGSNLGFPLQQKIIICTLMVMLKTRKVKEITSSKLYETYCRICKSKQLGVINQEEVNGLCTLLESQGIISIKVSKDARNNKVSLRLQESELEHAIQDKTLMSSILSDGLSS